MTEESFRVDLLECDLVLSTSEDVDFFHKHIGALSEVSLPRDGDLRVVVALGELAVLRVGKYHERNPEIVNFILGEQVIGSFRLQVVILQSREGAVRREKFYILPSIYL